MARYILLNKQIAYEKNLINCESVVRSNGTQVILTEDEVTRLGSLEQVASDLDATILSSKEALKLLEKKEWK